MTAAQIACALGGGHRCGAWWRCRCPVHSSRGATLALCDGDRALITVCHAGCSRADILAELQRRGLTDDSNAYHPPLVADRDGAARRIAWARAIWNSAQEATGTPMARYLAGRGIDIAPPPALRWAPALRRPDGTCGPAMVARIESIGGELIGVHRTWLYSDAAGQWRRRDRASLGPIGGGAVRLAAAAETLMVGEGIETCLAAMQATAVPAWAALSTSGLKALILPPLVRLVVILADNDTNGAGARAAYAAADRWLAEGRRVRIAMPQEPGTDFNNLLLGGGHAGETSDVAA